MEQTSTIIDNQSNENDHTFFDLKQIEEALHLPKTSLHVQTEKTVYNIIISRIALHNVSQEHIDEISRILSDKFIISKSAPNTIYKVEDMSFDRNPYNTSITEDKTSYLLAKYYENNLQLPLKHKSQPLLICQSIDQKRQKAFIIPEFSYIIDINMNVKDEVNSDEEEDDDYISPGNQMKEYFNKVLKIEEIDNTYNQISINEVREISENINQQNQVQSFLRKDKWMMLYPKKYEYKAKIIWNTIDLTKKVFNLNIEEPLMYPFGKDKEDINFLQSELKKTVKEGTLPSLLLILLLDKLTYAPLKKYCYEELGIATQFILLKKVNKIKKYSMNILMHMHLKTGGDMFKLLFNNKENNALICGITIGLHSQHEKFDYSLGITSSYNDSYSKYRFDYANIQTTKKPATETITNMLMKCYDNYEIMMGESPLVVLLYLQITRKTITKDQQNTNGVHNFLSIINKHFQTAKLPYVIITLEDDSNKSSFTLQKNVNITSSSYYSIQANTTSLSLNELSSLTLKLSIYNNSLQKFIPSCLRNSYLGYKLCQSLQINSIKEGLKNTPFYL